jgi:hypothetical protein
LQQNLTIKRTTTQSIAENNRFNSTLPAFKASRVMRARELQQIFHSSREQTFENG